MPNVFDARILIADDEPANVLLLESLLRKVGYRDLVTTTDARRVLPLFLDRAPDLLLLDLMMPHLDGHAVLNQVVPRVQADDYLPILVITADSTAETKRRALAAGAKDFLTKPIDTTEVLLRVRNLLETRWLYRSLRRQTTDLEGLVGVRTQELRQAQREILYRLGLAAEYRDDDTGEHTQRVGRLTGLIARALGQPEARVELLRLAAPLHDVGKIGIPDGILLKPGRLTPDEFERVKTHTTIGTKMLSGSSYALLHLAEEIALTHHERWDGTGYAGLTGEAIPLSGRIVSVADVFDALTHSRPYKDAWPLGRAVEEIAAQRERQFDPAVVDAFLQVVSAEGAGLLSLPSGEAWGPSPLGSGPGA